MDSRLRASEKRSAEIIEDDMPIAAAEASNATAEFVACLREFHETGRSNARVRFNAGCPPVKIQRVLTQLLSEHPDLPIDSVEIEGRSGCEFFRGTLRAETPGETHRWEFDWDCRWKAMEEGWTDGFGMPDQIRAARTFGYDCFRSWEHTPQGST